MNKSDENGTTMNDMNLDWFKFQEALGDMGYMGIVDIEGKEGRTLSSSQCRILLRWI